MVVAQKAELPCIKVIQPATNLLAASKNVIYGARHGLRLESQHQPVPYNSDFLVRKNINIAYTSSDWIDMAVTAASLT
jgi:hypothetical protein